MLSRMTRPGNAPRFHAFALRTTPRHKVSNLSSSRSSYVLVDEIFFIGAQERVKRPSLCISVVFMYKARTVISSLGNLQILVELNPRMEHVEGKRPEVA